MPKPIAIELFAGAGGLALGIQSAGFSVRALVEVDRFCCETLRRNSAQFFPDATVIERDIRKLTVPQLLQSIGTARSEIDLVSGGPPCQSFSISSIPKGGRLDSDPRDALLPHFARFVKKIRPHGFLFENVPGLLSKSGGKPFGDFLRSLRRLGYSTNYSVVNAAEYGVPQIRRRLFVIGMIGSGVPKFPPPLYQRKRTERGLPEYRTIREFLGKLSRKLPNQDAPKTTERRLRILRKMRPGAPWVGWRHKDKWAGPSRCITAHCRYDWVHPLRSRPATVRELAELQTFPHDYVFYGPTNAPNNAGYECQYRLVGNSVPILLSKMVAEGLRRYLHVEEYRHPTSTMVTTHSQCHSRRTVALPAL